jgi:hypothetical protein
MVEIETHLKKRKPKPYQRAEYPGQKVQIDVKIVPSWSVADGQKYYQYTAIDTRTMLLNILHTGSDSRKVSILIGALLCKAMTPAVPLFQRIMPMTKL